MGVLATRNVVVVMRVAVLAAVAVAVIVEVSGMRGAADEQCGNNEKPHAVEQCRVCFTGCLVFLTSSYKLRPPVTIF